jgi:predicted small lipoprotein YifL
MTLSRRRLAFLLFFAALSGSLAGCGRKGDLEPALDASTKPATSAGENVSPIEHRSRRVPITPSKDPFILDPLL